MKNLTTRFKNNLKAARTQENGDVIQTILMIAIFVVIVVVVGTIIYKAVQSKAETVGNCVKNAGKVNSGGTTGTITGASC